MYLSYGLIFMGVGLVFTGLTILIAFVVSTMTAWLSTRLAIRIHVFGTKLSDLLLPTVLGGLASLALLAVLTISPL
jgi:hypothetical protein